MAQQSLRFEFFSYVAIRIKLIRSVFYDVIILYFCDFPMKLILILSSRCTPQKSIILGGAGRYTSTGGTSYNAVLAYNFFNFHVYMLELDKTVRPKDSSKSRRNLFLHYIWNIEFHINVSKDKCQKYHFGSMFVSLHM